MNNKTILCMGSINIDLVMYMNKMPVPGETIVTDNFHTFPGGKGGNQAATAGELGGHVKYLTKLGDDAFSDELIKEQIKRNVDTSSIIIEKGATAGIAMIRVDENGQNSISFTPGANKMLTPQDVIANAHVFDGCDILLITMEIAVDTVYKAIEIAKEKGMIVVLDPAPAPVEGLPKHIAAMVDYSKPNETEASILTGIEVKDEATAIEALFALKAMGMKTPIVTLADAGAVTFVDGEILTIPPMKVQSVDSTAAGDIFIGAFTAALAENKSFVDCLNFAKCAAAISTTRKGAQSSIPIREEVERAVSALN